MLKPNKVNNSHFYFFVGKVFLKKNKNFFNKRSNFSFYLGKFFLDLLSLSIDKLREKNSHESTYPTNAQKNFKRFELMLETSLDVRLTLGEYAIKSAYPNVN